MAPERRRKRSGSDSEDSIGEDSDPEKLILQSYVQPKDCYSRHTPSILIWTENNQKEVVIDRMVLGSFLSESYGIWHSLFTDSTELLWNVKPTRGPCTVFEY